MEKMSLNTIREKFLEFFEEKEHHVVNSYPLVPQNDKSLLLINAGMAPLKSYFMGTEEPPSKRMATCQKCIRTGGIDNVGKTDRHGTFFEMLGNFSFGDYFKRESLEWGWEFCTEVLDLPVDKLWATVYFEDDEAYALWKDNIKIPEDRIVRLGKEDNFWEIGTGPCGPCSEIYYDRGEKYPCVSDTCEPGDDGDRFIEFWNHVFTQFDKDEAGEYHLLAKPNIDTGMGLERIAMIMQGVESIFEVDTIKAVLDEVVRISGKQYGKDKQQDISIRIITDHIRSVTFLVSDGVMPNNEGRGYVLRRLLRRAARHGKLLGIKKSFLTDLVDIVIETSGDAYPNLKDRADYIKKIIALEEARFDETIDQGTQILEEYIRELMAQKERILDGELAFKLYDTYGFPIDLVKEILEEKGLDVDEESFYLAMERQRERARKAREDGDHVGWEETAIVERKDTLKTTFVGYDQLKKETKILAIIKNGVFVNRIDKGDVAEVFLEETPFYAEGGGQVGDRGVLSKPDMCIDVTETVKGPYGTTIHRGQVLTGTFYEDEFVQAKVDEKLRMATARNHSVTHLLHRALRLVLGDHVEQAGSYVDERRLRFDFSHFEALGREEIEEIERIVNREILRSLPVQTEVLTMTEAVAGGAMALFGEKYEERVRVVSMGGFSKELCGGTHLERTSEAGLFKILSETGIAAGIRRIEAVTGENAINYLSGLEERVGLLIQTLKTDSDHLVDRVSSLLEELKTVERENDSLKQKLANSTLDELLASSEEVDGIKVITGILDGVDVNTLRNLGDQIRGLFPKSFALLANVDGDKVVLMAMASDEAVKEGVHAGNLIREAAKITGGGGGGKPQMAQAGGRDASKLPEAFAAVKSRIKDR